MLVIEEFLLLNALLRTLCTAKFDTSPADMLEYAGSPFLAEVCDRVYDALIAAARRELKESVVTSMERGRAADDRPLVIGAIQSYKALVAERWRGWGEAERRDFLRVLAAPYRLSEERMVALLEDSGQSDPPAAGG